MPFVPLPDSDTDPHAHPVGFPIATTRQWEPLGFLSALAACSEDD